MSREPMTEWEEENLLSELDEPLELDMDTDECPETNTSSPRIGGLRMPSSAFESTPETGTLAAIADRPEGRA